MSNDPKTVRDVVRYLGVFALVGLVVLGALLLAIILRDADPAAYAAAITPIVTLVASAVTAIGVLLANAGSVDTSKLDNLADLVRTERDKAVAEAQAMIAEAQAMIAATAAPLRSYWVEGTDERYAPDRADDGHTPPQPYEMADPGPSADVVPRIDGVAITDPSYGYGDPDPADDTPSAVVGVA